MPGISDERRPELRIDRRVIQKSPSPLCAASRLDKEMACQSRRRILDMVASEGIVVAGAHVNAPGFGHVVRKGTTYAFESA